MEKIIIAYMPALHEGYIKFLKNHSEATLYIVSQEILDELAIEMPYFGRDVRAIDPEIILTATRSLNLVKDVKLLDQKVIEDLQKFEGEIIMPTEDISTEITKRFPSPKIKYDSVFLR